MATEPLDGHDIYQLRITLQDSEPVIWRRVQVPATTTLAKLHQVIQLAMGWTDSHMHEFNVGKQVYGRPLPYDAYEVRNEKSITLQNIVEMPRKSFQYVYDMGDDWVHMVKIEKILPRQAGIRYPVCIDGQRACPPEDCGGVFGYEEVLHVLADPNHPEYDEQMEWLGTDFDPEYFDLDAVNKQLRRLKIA